MSVRLYGRSVGNGSLSVVTAGFREALEHHGLLAGMVALDRTGGDEEDLPPPGALAHDAVFTGNLSHMSFMSRGTKHERHWVTVTPNSTYIPQKLLAAALEFPGLHILSASAWGSEVIAQNLREMEVPDPPPILTVRHGVSGFAPVLETIEKTREDFRKGQFRVVHFSTSDGQRKGTLELIRAWKLLTEDARFPKSAELFLVLDHHARAALQQRMVFEDETMPENVRLLPRGDLDAATMSRLLCHMHLVAAPSRGEGFGLLPLQARACGVPCVATLTTGHSAGHCEGTPAIIKIIQPPGLVEIDDGPGALAQAVLPEDIAGAIWVARLSWEIASICATKDAPYVAEEWSWKNQLAPLMEQLR